ncbi:uncharacterized protein LOC121385854 isoform X2 [Gigantopelta aegis]|uniref:uncharacterized protein LOC121385854 isoform X2 n=1 Tax=Gigantopelta aegis TaxID=1735272 RepID=UPI001B8888B4|nr:uncharacterized protein LOC121385854 isoform X2 [Gigantopelta aegis]
MTGYTGTIVSPTQHNLTIHSFSTETDVGEWICLDGPIGAGPLSCNMTLYKRSDNRNLSKRNLNRELKREEMREAKLTNQLSNR